MRRTDRRIATGRLAATAFATLLVCSVAPAAQFSVDWDSPAFAWPAAPSNLSATYSVGGGDVSLTFGGDTSAFDSGSPTIAQTPTGGLSPVQNVLHLDIDFGPGSSNQVTLTIDFTHPGGVSGVRFSIFDIDRSTTFWDQVVVQAFDGAQVLNPTSVVIGNPSPLVGNTFIPPNVVTGTSSINNNLDDANATFVFAQSGIRQVVIVATYPGSASDPQGQILGLHDILFETGATNIGPDARDDTVGTDVDTPITIDVLANDVDAEGDPLTLSLPSTTTAQGGTVAINDNGTPSDPTDDRIDYTPPAGFLGTDTFQYSVSDPGSATDTATVTVLIPANAADLRLSKQADRNQAAPGEIVRYTVEIENTGALDLTALTLVDRIPAGFIYVTDSADLQGGSGNLAVTVGSSLRFDGVNVAAAETATLSYLLQVGPAVAPGQYVNTIEASTASAGLGLPASATVVVTGDPDFEQTTLIGKVFHDRDGDGLQAPGEEGIPGVRLATVTGLLIETDAHGRYHLAGLDGGTIERGRNFIIKVDPATLPAGAEFTTENPRVKRITQGLLNRIDFGVRFPEHESSCCKWVETKIGEIYFKPDDDMVWPEYYPVLRELAARLKERGGGVLVLEGVDEARARKVSDALAGLLGESLAGAVSVVQRRPAADNPCVDEPCDAPRGYEFQIISGDRLPTSVLEDDRARAERDARVDLSSRFRVELPLGGSVWAVEDPTTIDPRLAVHGPDRLPFDGGRITEPATFVVYSNYMAFVERAEIAVYGPDDMDRIDPLAVIDVPVEAWGQVVWDGYTRHGRLQAGDEVFYVARVYDAKGRFDETRPRAIRLAGPGDFSAPRLRAVDRQRSRRATEADTGSSSLVDGSGVLVFRPPRPEVARESRRQLYTIRPEFATDMQTLTRQDETTLDGVITQWKDVEDLRLIVSGHTERALGPPRTGGQFDDNYELSEAMARTVADYLARGLQLKPRQVEVIGKGGDEPVASNVTAEGRDLNRRVEIRVRGERVTTRDSGYGEITLVDPETGVTASATTSLEQAERVVRATNAAADRRRQWRDPAVEPEPFGEPPATATLDADTLDAIYGRNDLSRQTIPLHGSRVRIHGSDVPRGYEVALDGRSLPIDSAGAFAVEQLLPVGRQSFDVTFSDPDGRVVTRTLPVEVTGRHLFYVALADLTVSGNSPSGDIEPLAGDERYEEDTFVEGRVAMYLKGKIKGKYLITAQLDSTEEELKDLLDNLDEEDPASVFRRLDPDRYYPVYGDDSTTYSDTDTQGRFYVRLDWDRSQALWGNYHTGITGNELAQYNRSLYGARLHYRTQAITELGAPRSEVIAFGSEAQTALGHSEFRGTGGSLYYLKHKDLLPGSDKVRIEIRDRDSDRVVENVALARGADYEIDEIQGRIILTRPLSQVASQVAPSLIKDEPLDGNAPVLIVDYEYVPDGFQADQVTAGARGKQWLGNHVAVGGTYVSEKRDGEDYTLAGGDLTLQAGQGTFLKLEYADTEQSQAPRFFSDNGGMTFTELNAGAAAQRDGAAYAAEARANFRELLGGDRDWIAGAWWRETEEGFSVARRDLGIETTEYGAEMIGEVGDRVKLSARAAVTDRADDSENQRYSLQTDVRSSRNGLVSTELRQIRERGPSEADFVEGTLGAVRYSHRLGDNVDLYAIGQFTLDDDDERYEQNDLGTLGTYMRFGQQTGLRAEASTGDRGDAGTLTLDHKIGRDHVVYGSYVHSTDRTDTPRSNRVAVGHRSRISDQTTVYTENQFVSQPEQAGVAHVFGLDFTPRPGRTIGVTFQTGELDAIDGGIVDRDAFGVSVGYSNAITRWTSRIEFRRDAGAEEREQWLTATRVEWKVHEGLRLLARFNLSDTDDDVDVAVGARFVEGGLGLAYRPARHDRVNVIGRYTFLYDLPSPAQFDAGTDQRSHVFSVEGAYRLTARWELASKLAQRLGELRASRGEGDWFESTANFVALRTNFHVVSKWDLLLEYRVLDADETETTRQGFLAGLDRHLGDHFKVGLGYNFTDFSDDLTDLQYDNNGWFVNFVTKY